MFAALLSCAGPAHAASEVAPAAEPKADERRSYGGQTLAADAISCGLIAGGLWYIPTPPIGVLGYLFGGPVIHAAHGSAGKAVGSLGMRLGLPVFAMVAVAASAGGGSLGPFLPPEGGAALGAVTAAILDAAILANEPAPGVRTRVVVVPTATPHQAGMELTGRF